MSPTARTLTALRRCGHVAGVVERFIAGVGERGQGIRRDLFGCIDIIAARRGEPGAVGIQATTRSNLSARIAKARRVAELRTWLAAGCRFQAWGWFREEGGRWAVKIVELRGDDLDPVPLTREPRRRRADRQPGLFADM